MTNIGYFDGNISKLHQPLCNRTGRSLTAGCIDKKGYGMLEMNIDNSCHLVKICPHITICGRKIKRLTSRYIYKHTIQIFCKCCKKRYRIVVYSHYEINNR